jgi:hypothetical protein
LFIPIIEIAHDMSEAPENTNVHKNCKGSKGLQAGCENLRQLNFEASLGASFFSMIGKKFHFLGWRKKVSSGRLKAHFLTANSQVKNK